MRLSLKLHPDSTSKAATGVDVEVTHQENGRITLSFKVSGNLNALQLPAPAAPARADELWRHTCFEAFLNAPPDASYYELNFSPSKQWAAYRFSGYRAGMQTAPEIGSPTIETASGRDTYTLQADVDFTHASILPGAKLRLGFSAVIEETSGNKSYWALAHGPGKPDFHRADCFTLEFS